MGSREEGDPAPAAVCVAPATSGFGETIGLPGRYVGKSLHAPADESRSFPVRPAVAGGGNGMLGRGPR